MARGWRSEDGWGVEGGEGPDGELEEEGEGVGDEGEVGVGGHCGGFKYRFDFVRVVMGGGGFCSLLFELPCLDLGDRCRCD